MFDNFYGFGGRPFQLTPDATFYFKSRSHRKALECLGNGLARGAGFVVITGAAGTGKSMLAAHVMATIDRQRQTAARIMATPMPAGKMMRAVALAFGLGPCGPGKGDALRAIEALARAEDHAGRGCLLVVDEAQHLTAGALEDLRLLSGVRRDGRCLLPILLLGGAVPGGAARRRGVAAHHVQPMEPDEIEAYVCHRLRLVGWCGLPSFDPGVFDGMAVATGGVPRRINQIANRLLILGAVEQAGHMDAVMLARVLADLSSDGALATFGRGPVGSAAPAPEALTALMRRIDAIESRLAEQDHALRHTLAMLTKWIERDDAGRCAA